MQDTGAVPAGKEAGPAGSRVFAIALVLIVVVGWAAARMMGLSMPDKLSRDSLAALPYVGNLMAVFLAGWMFFRVIRVSSKGVRWLFPSDDPRRRRR